MNTILALSFAIGVLAILVYASWHDIKTRTIPKLSVAAIYFFVMGYLVFADKDLAIASFCFMFTFITFICLWFISFGNFGIGDVLILSALGWMVGDLALLKAFFIVLGVLTIPYALFIYWYYQKPAKLYKRYTTGKPYLYPYMPVIFFTTLLYVVIPSIFVSLFE